MRRVVNVVLLLALVAAGVSIWLGRGHWAELPWREHAAAPRSPAPLPSLADPARVVVLNGTGVKGLANSFSLGLPSLGCVVERIGNAPHPRFAGTLLVNRGLDDAVADAIAQRLGGIPVLKEADDRAAEDAVLVLGADHAAVLREMQR